jgi:hypothetical protein
LSSGHRKESAGLKQCKKRIPHQSKDSHFAIGWADGQILGNLALEVIVNSLSDVNFSYSRAWLQ